MAKSINQVILMGHVGQDPRVVDIPTNNPNSQEQTVKAAQFSLATSKGGFKRQDGSEVSEVTQWHNVVAWRKLAEIVEKYVKKGDLVTVIGELQYRTYQHKQHQDVTMYATDIVATDIVLTGKGDGGTHRPPLNATNIPNSGAAAGYGQGQAPASQPAQPSNNPFPAQQPQGAAPFPPPADSSTGGSDDLPFDFGGAVD